MDSINISGNFNTKKREIEAVKALLTQRGVEYTKVEECSDANDGDVVVTAYGQRIIIEVKEEDYLNRFAKYKQLGIDFLSVFHFKPTVSRYDWRGVKSSEDYQTLLDAIDRSAYCKPGKVFYSKSHLWLFFSFCGGEFKYAEFFDGKNMTSDDFKNHLFSMCQFAVNNKSAEQLSCSDSFQSAVIFINSNDSVLNTYRVDDLKGFIQSVEQYTIVWRDCLQYPR